jgi:hypothetical protein
MKSKQACSDFMLALKSWEMILACCSEELILVIVKQTVPVPNFSASMLVMGVWSAYSEWVKVIDAL